MEGRIALAGIDTPAFELSGRRCLNVMYAMILENMSEEERDEFNDTLWMSPEEHQARAERKRRRDRQVLATIGEIR